MDKELIQVLSQLLDDKLRPVNEKLDKHSEILAEHSQILTEHSQILTEHSQILAEHTQILRALEHLAEVNKAEHDKMSNDIVHIKGDITAIRKDLSTVEIITANNYADIARLKAVK